MQQHDLVIRGHLGDVGLVVATPRSSTVRSIASLVSGGRYGGHAMKRTSTDGMLTPRGEEDRARREGQGQELACRRAQLRLGQKRSGHVRLQLVCSRCLKKRKSSLRTSPELLGRLAQPILVSMLFDDPTPPPCPCCGQPMKFIKAISRVGGSLKIFVFYCSRCKQAQTEVQREEAA